jgi:predicted DCC family thiol-disulfide oxidoreductase YuxK
MRNNTAIKFLPIVSDEKKVEVSLTDNQAIIKLSTWTDDLGWLCQKTLTIDAAMLDNLHRVIASARYRLNKQKSEIAEPVKTADVLEFPIFS